MATVNVNAYSYGTSTYGSHEFGEDSLPIVISASASVAGSCERIQQSALEISVTSGVASIGGFTAAADAIVSATSTTTCSGQRLALFPSGNIVAASSVSITGNATFASGGSVTVSVSSGVSAAGEKFILEETDAQGYGSYVYGVGVFDLSNLQTIITATSTVTCNGEKINVDGGQMTSTATVSAIARRVALGSVLINGTSVTVATSNGNGTRVRTSAAPMTSTSTVVPASTIVRVRESSANPSATTTITCNSVFMVNGAATVSPTATIAAICNRVRFGSGTPTANASIAVLGFATRGGIASTGGTQHYNVTVQSVGGYNKYFLNGVQQPILNLVEGNTYVFNYPSSHPFRFSTTSDGTHNSGAQYTTGVTHNSSTKTTIVVAVDAPDLYYYCSIHSGMGGIAYTPSNLVFSTVASDSERIHQGHAVTQPASSLLATCNRVQSTSGAVSATSVTATVGREKWEIIVNDSVTWTQIAA